MSENENLATVEVVSAEIDPVLCNIEMPLQAVFHPLGFTLELSTNSPAVMAAAQQSWNRFPKTFSEPTVRFRVGVMGAAHGECPPSPKVNRAWQHLITTIADPQNFAVCDLRQGLGYAWLTPAAANDTAYLRYYFLEGPILSLVNNRYMTPLHAACVQREGHGVLLCGDSGAGKSSLSYACALRGWTFIADDSCYLIRGRANREVVGNPYQIRFREAGTQLFPELRTERANLRATGDFAIELATDKAKNITTALTSSVDYVVFLNRREPDPPGLAPFPKEAALPWFGQMVCYGEDTVRQAQMESLQHLMSAQILELCYRDLDWAVQRLEALVRDGR
jgi:hypothetical protein